MKDIPEIIPMFERFAGWSNNSPPVAEFIQTDGKSNWAGFHRVEALFKNKETLHPYDQNLVTIAFRSYEP